MVDIVVENTSVEIVLQQQKVVVETGPLPRLKATEDALAQEVEDRRDAVTAEAAARIAADALKAPLASPTFTGTVSGITKSMVGLGSADNTADTAKPVSTAQQAALDLKTPNSRIVSAAGLATGGGSLAADRTITVPKASGAEATAGNDDTKAVTPLGVGAATRSVAELYATISDENADWDIGRVFRFAATGREFDFAGGSARIGTEQAVDATSLAAVTFARASAATMISATGAVSYVASGAPRINSLGYLSEGIQTNEVWPSGDFTHANWGKLAGSDVAVVAGAALGPDGTMSASRIIPQAGASGAHRLDILVTLNTLAQVATGWAIFKANGYERLSLAMVENATPANFVSAQFNGTTGAFIRRDQGGTATGLPTYEIWPLANGYWLVFVTGQCATSGTVMQLRLSVLNDAGLSSFVGEPAVPKALLLVDTGVFKGYPSSPIRTTTAAGSRAADVLTASATLPKSYEITAQFDRIIPSVEQTIYCWFTDANNRARIYKNTAGKFVQETIVGGVRRELVGATVVAGMDYTLRGRFETNNVAFHFGGEYALYDTDAALPAVTTAIAGASSDSTLPLYGRVKLTTEYPFYLTDLEILGSPSTSRAIRMIDGYVSDGPTYRASISAMTGVTYTGGVNGRYEENAAGLLVPVAVNVIPEFAGCGLYTRPATTRRGFNPNNLTAVQWTAVNGTATRDTGADGVALSGSRFTATSANATISQAITDATSRQRRLNPYLKRITGTGPILLSLDGGLTTVDVTAQVVTGRFTQIRKVEGTAFNGVGQTLANPTPMLILSTSGDAVTIQFFNPEDNEIDTSPIDPGVLGVITRAGDALTLPASAIPGAMRMRFKLLSLYTSGISPILAYWSMASTWGPRETEQSYQMLVRRFSSNLGSQPYRAWEYVYPIAIPDPNPLDGDSIGDGDGMFSNSNYGHPSSLTAEEWHNFICTNAPLNQTVTLNGQGGWGRNYQLPAIDTDWLAPLIDTLEIGHHQGLLQPNALIDIFAEYYDVPTTEQTLALCPNETTRWHEMTSRTDY